MSYWCRTRVILVSYRTLCVIVFQKLLVLLCCIHTHIHVRASQGKGITWQQGPVVLFLSSNLLLFFRIKYKFSLSITLLQAVGFLSPQKTKMYASLHSMTALFYFSGFKKSPFLKVQSNLNLYPLLPKTLRFEGFVS